MEIDNGEGERERIYDQLLEVVTAVLQQQMPAQNAAQLLMPISSKESLQQVLVDALWLGGFAATEVPGNKEARDEFTNFCCLLEREGVVSKPILAAGLETETLPPAVCNMSLLRKKQNQAKTKARYTVTRFNLLREHNEGYARVIMYMDRLIHLDCDVLGDSDELTKIRESIIEDIMLLIGHSYLCPNRIIAMAIDIYEKLMMEEEEPSKRPQALVSLLRRFSRERLTKIAAFLVSIASPVAGSKDVKDGKDAKDGKFDPEPRLSQFMAIASLISINVIDLRTLWSYLEPGEKKIQEAYHLLQRKYEAKLKTISVVDLSGKSNLAKDKRYFSASVKNFNQLLNKKIRMVEAMISINDWRNACIMLTIMRRICRPCMNHYLRSALCDLLKWIIQPLLPKTASPPYKSSRRFAWGLLLQGSEGPVPVCLPQATDINDFASATKQVLDQLEYYLHTDNVAMGNLWQVMALSLKDPPGPSPVIAASAHSAAPSNQILDDRLVTMIYKHLLPAISIAKPNPWLSSMAWNVLRQLTIFQRYMIYSCWETRYSQFMLKYSYEEAKFEAKKILKRVVSSDKSDRDRDDPNAYKPSPVFCQLCQTNPIPIVEVMLKDIEIGFNVNMIQPYVDLTGRCSEMMTDVVGYVLARNCERGASETRTFLNPADGFLSPWLSNFAEFIGRFYKKHPQTNLVGILTAVCRRMMSDLPEGAGAGSAGSGRQSSKKFKGESLIRVVLEKLMEHMGGLIVVKDLTAEQLLCLAGGPRLRLESVSVGARPDPLRKEKTRKALMDSLVELGLATALWDCLSKQRLFFLSESFSEVNSGEGALKLLCALIDGSQDCFLSLIDFISQAAAREKYMKLVPPFQQIFGVLEPPLAYAALRPGLPPFARGASKADAKASLVATPEEVELHKQLLGVAQQCLTRSTEEDGLSMDFYVTFWRLSLQDIFVPTDGYEKVLSRMMNSQRQFEDTKARMERNRNFDNHSRDYKTLQRNIVRQKEVYDKVKEEHLQQKLNFEKVLARLELEKSGWFLKKDQEATQALVAEMFMPRALTSYADAMFCCKFVRLLIRMKTPGFLFLDFFNCWTLLLCMNLRGCTEREAQICGIILREMMSYVFSLRQSEKTYEQEMKDNPCFHRHHYDETQLEGPVEFAKHSEIVRAHSKWEGKIYKTLKISLESEEWTDKRNALLLLSQSCESCPVAEKFAKGVLHCVENVREREKASDLKTLANSLAVKLKACSKTWVKQEAREKAAPKSVAKPKEAPKEGAPKEGTAGATPGATPAATPAATPTATSAATPAATPPAKELPKETKDAKPKPKEKPKEKEPKEQKEQKQETKGRSKEKERDHKRRADAPRNGGDERSEKRRRGDDDAKKGDDDVVMISSHRPATGRSGAARNSLAVQPSHSDRDRSSRTVSSYGDRADRRPTAQYSRAHDRLDRRR